MKRKQLLTQQAIEEAEAALTQTMNTPKDSTAERTPGSAATCAMIEYPSFKACGKPADFRDAGKGENGWCKEHAKLVRQHGGRLVTTKPPNRRLEARRPKQTKIVTMPKNNLKPRRGASLPPRTGSANLVDRAFYTQSRQKRDGYWSQWRCDSPHFKRLRQAETHWKHRREHLKNKTEKWWPPEQSRLVYGIFDYRQGLPYKLTQRILRRCHSPNDGTQRPGTPDGSLATEMRKPGSLK